MNPIINELNSFCSDTLVDTLGIVFTDYKDNELYAKLPLSRKTSRPDGNLHGGANMVLIETLAGAIGVLQVPKEKAFSVFGVEINANHIKQPHGAFLTAKASFIHNGRRSQVVEVHIYDEDGTVISVGRVTNMIVEK